MDKYLKINDYKKIALPPVGKLIGFYPVEVKSGEAIFKLETKQEHFNPMGTVHGGILCDVADAAMGIAFATLLEEDESFTTIELKINYLKPVWETVLSAHANVIKKGKSIGLIECIILDENESLVAKASSTCMVLNGKSAKNRAIKNGGTNS